MKKESTYFINIKFKSSVKFDEQLLTRTVIHPAITQLHLRNIGVNDGKVESELSITFKSTDESYEFSQNDKIPSNSIEVAKDVLNTIFGLMCIRVSEGITFDSFVLKKENATKYVQMGFGPWGYEIRGPILVLPYDIYFEKYERKGFYWIHKAFNASHPDYEMGYLFSAIECFKNASRTSITLSDQVNKFSFLKKLWKVVLSPLKGYMERRRALNAIRYFLKEKCCLNEKEIKEIIVMRNDIIHGRRSSVDSFLPLTNANAILMRDLRYYLKNEFEFDSFAPDLEMGKEYFTIFE